MRGFVMHVFRVMVFGVEKNVTYRKRMAHQKAATAWDYIFY
ncbi:hypothetical protein Z948_1560 [Sulfitobacter donghicola DSW-25 = KCTC 12864 = JCM 14565]|nr:hypothetical protein Z948_1560 [Sulfitobacter donghicola DSW-25 = KCTC 12864 = JCM 14565]